MDLENLTFLCFTYYAKLLTFGQIYHTTENRTHTERAGR